MYDTDISIGDAIRLYLKKSKLGNTMQSIQITAIWEQIMGKTIAKYTDKIEIYNHKLIIHTKVPTLKQELNFQKPKIITLVNEAMHDNIITEVVVK